MGEGEDVKLGHTAAGASIGPARSQPITLIDGEKLVELLAKHEVGVKKRKIEVWELDESAFQGAEEG